MMHRPALLHLNQLRRGINSMFISERFCNPLLHFKMTKDDEMPKVEEMAAVRLTNILWETCTNILGLHWQIHHGSVWQPDQYDQMIKQGGGAEDIRVNPVRGVGSTCITMRKSILQKSTCSIEIYKTWICPPDFCRRVPQPPVFSSPPPPSQGWLCCHCPAKTSSPRWIGKKVTLWGVFSAQALSQLQWFDPGWEASACDSENPPPCYKLGERAVNLWAESAGWITAELE